MPEQDFTSVRSRLLEAGVAPRHASRIAQELNDHYRDLCADFAAEGIDGAEAIDMASAQLGPLDAVIESVSRRPELRLWCYRYPRLGRIALPLAYMLALPAVPLAAGAGYVPALARWSAIMAASACITAATFLIMQMSITLG